ncbi:MULTISPECIES: LutC/YkgG family protein [unclassified Streptomyces]|uniref:LutC/YkgG family protein n=1 Tax=unclassified Streptomyces TaxID=2593676 RepID=UPI002E33540E|nr:MULTISPECIES: LUD domain-containing protein [unclassified Streptomyces]WUC63709.1 LUD domain-containing protein [Streptomyces sp. NBC_00539]
MSGRDRVLGRIRRALGEPGAGGAGTGRAPVEAAAGEDGIPRDYLRVHGDRTPAESADLLAAHLREYRAKVHRTDEDGLAPLLARLLAARGARTVLVPPGLPPSWLDGAQAVRVEDRADSTPYALDAVDSVVTGCALAVAETGTIVLDGGPDQGRRRITLIPDHHICVVRVPGQLVDSVPQALERLDPTRPLTWISGPSATSDIELDRVEGVHGPRTLEVVLIDAPAQ